MIRIEYPKNRQRLKDRYVAAFASYKKLEKMQEKWDEAHKRYVEKYAWIKTMLSM